MQNTFKKIISSTNTKNKRIHNKKKTVPEQEEAQPTKKLINTNLMDAPTNSLVKEAYSYVMQQLEKYCGNYPFHNPEHTKNVFERSTYLGLNENISLDDLQDIQIASLFHDIGFIESYPKNEYIGAELAGKWLNTKSYDIQRREKIKNLIMATVLFSEPRTLLEEIIQDSDMDNIGTKASFTCSQRLFSEIREIAHVEVSECTYWQFAYKVNAYYHFHTKTAQIERNNQRILNLKHIKAYLDMVECEIPKGYDYLERIV